MAKSPITLAVQKAQVEKKHSYYFFMRKSTFQSG